MPTVASHVISQQSLSTPAYSLCIQFSVSGFGCVGFRPIDWQAKGFRKKRLLRRIMIANYLKAGLICLCALGMYNNSLAQTSGTPIKNIVPVHGAWADGSGWRGVYDILVKYGYNVSIVQEPETSFKDDVAATKRVLALQGGPCILVAHSYGGSVITEAGNDPSVVGLVYIAAHIPDSGEK